MIVLGDGGYDPDFFGADLGGALGGALGETVGAAIAAGLPPSVTQQKPTQPTPWDFVHTYRCGQGKTSYRCYGIGKATHSRFIELQHQLNRAIAIDGGTPLAEDGILGPMTFRAIQKSLPFALPKSPIYGAVMQFMPMRTVDDAATMVEGLIALYKDAIDRAAAPEPAQALPVRLLAAFRNTQAQTSSEVAADKQQGFLPASFTQDQVKASDDVFTRIAGNVGSVDLALAAKAIDRMPTATGEAWKYWAVGAGLTAVGFLAIVAIAVSRKRS